MTRFEHDRSAVAVGTDIAVDGSDYDVLVIKGTNSTIKVAAGGTPVGTKSMRTVSPAGEQAIVADNLSTSVLHFSTWFRVNSLATASTQIFTPRNSTAIVASAVVTTAAQCQIRIGSGSGVNVFGTTPTIDIAGGAWYKLKTCTLVGGSTTTGKMIGQLLNVAGTVLAQGEITTGNSGTTPITVNRVGVIDSAAAADIEFWGETYDDATSYPTGTANYAGLIEPKTISTTSNFTWGESMGITDTGDAQTLDSAYVLQESFGLADAFSLSVAKTTSFTWGESMGLADTGLDQTIGAEFLLGENVGITDAYSNATSSARSFIWQESENLTDTFNLFAAGNYFVSSTDVENLLDTFSLATTGTVNLPFTDNENLLDSFALFTAGTVNFSNTDGIGIADSFSLYNSGSISPVFQENVSLTESFILRATGPFTDLYGTISISRLLRMFYTLRLGLPESTKKSLAELEILFYQLYLTDDSGSLNDLRRRYVAEILNAPSELSYWRSQGHKGSYSDAQYSFLFAAVASALGG